MQNVLNFPTNRARKKSLTKNILNFIENCRIRKEESFQAKIEFLKNECYEEFLKKILKQRKEKGVPDLPEWMYEQRRVICIEALNKSVQAVNYVYEKYGKKHIEECYKNKIKLNRLKRK